MALPVDPWHARARASERTKISPAEALRELLRNELERRGWRPAAAEQKPKPRSAKRSSG